MNIVNDKSSILFIHHNCEIGGAELSLLDLIININRDLFNPVVVIPNDGPLYRRLRSKDIIIRIENIPWFKSTFNPFKLLSYLVQLFRVILKLRNFVRAENIVLIHTNSISSQIIGGTLARIEKIANIWHLRDILTLNMINRFIFRFCGMYATKIIVISKSVKNHIYDLIDDKSKIKVIYNGIDLKRFNGALISKKDESITVGIVSRLVPWKGHIEFIQAAQIVLSMFSNVRFFIIGDTFQKDIWYKNKIKKKIEALRLNKHIILVSHKDNILPQITLLDIVVVPSKRPEPFGRIIIESMALSKPVVATLFGGPTEIVDNNKTGFLVNPNVPTEIAEKIIELIKNPYLRIQMGLNGRKRVEQLFLLSNTISNVQKLYCECLREFEG